MQKRIEKLLSEISEKYNLPLEVIKEIYNSEWLFVKRQINTLEFPIIMLPSWGKYIPSKTKLKKLEKHYDKKKENIKEGTTKFDKLIEKKNNGTRSEEVISNNNQS